ncbi:hypothetical protein MRB53_040912 [Persea americana]|nr:hypothetical protein MRB53_040912 [Persea americana]
MWFLRVSLCISFVLSLKLLLLCYSTDECCFRVYQPDGTWGVTRVRVESATARGVINRPMKIVFNCILIGQPEPADLAQRRPSFAMICNTDLGVRPHIIQTTSLGMDDHLRTPLRDKGFCRISNAEQERAFILVFGWTQVNFQVWGGRTNMLRDDLQTYSEKIGDWINERSTLGRVARVPGVTPDPLERSISSDHSTDNSIVRINLVAAH